MDKLLQVLLTGMSVSVIKLHSRDPTGKTHHSIEALAFGREQPFI